MNHITETNKILSCILLSVASSTLTHIKTAWYREDDCCGIIIISQVQTLDWADFTRRAQHFVTWCGHRAARFGSYLDKIGLTKHRGIIWNRH